MTPADAARAPRVAVAGLSARLVAQSAARAGLNVVALDIFGDRDTREHAGMWFDIGGNGLSIDRARLYDALERAARLPRMLGLIVTSGLESLAGELARAPRVPRFIGNGAQAAAVRDPRRFFALLDEAHIGHPEVRYTPPDDRHEWLVKRSDGCGGTHIEWADEVERIPADAYFQRLAQGRSMSALFVAAHRERGEGDEGNAVGLRVGLELARSRDAVLDRHGQVHQHELRVLELRDARPLLAVAREQHPAAAALEQGAR